MSPRALNIAPGRPEVPSEPPTGPSRRQTSFNQLRRSPCDCLLTLSLPMGSRGLKVAPRWPPSPPTE
eukprot:8526601-Pyramimonas_sp.AAC.1